MNPTSKYTIGIRFGLIAGFTYVVLLFLRYKFFASTPPSFIAITLCSYLVILMIYLFAGIARKKQLGGFADLKEIFQSIFIVILITELFYVLFNFIFLKYIDAGFLDRFQESSINYFRKMNFSSEQIETQMKSIRAMSDTVKPGGLIKGFGTIIVIDSIFGFIFAAIISRKKSVLEKPKL